MAKIAHCPECGATVKAAACESDVPLIKSTKGISLPCDCANGHKYAIRISAWWAVYSEAVPKLKANAQVWELETLQAAVKARERELEIMKEKLFDMRKKLKARMA